MKKVVKFGGSSLANAEQFQKVGEIIRSEESRRYVVPSAPGKRFDGDTKVTDMLYSCYEAAEAGRSISTESFRRSRSVSRRSSGDFLLNFPWIVNLSRLRLIFQHMQGREYAASRGEYSQW